LDFSKIPAKVNLGLCEKNADVNFTVAEDDFVQLFTQKLDGSQAWINGQLKAAGNIEMALAFNKVVELLSNKYVASNGQNSTYRCL